MEFLSDSDLKGSISAGTLTSLRGTLDENLDQSEAMAISEIAPLRELYDIDAEIRKTTDQRNAELIRILVAFTIYYLYNTVEDDSIPERVNNNYEKELKAVMLISQGKQSTTLERLTDDTGETISHFRFNDEQPRDLDAYNI